MSFFSSKLLFLFKILQESTEVSCSIIFEVGEQVTVSFKEIFSLVSDFFTIPLLSINMLNIIAGGATPITALSICLSNLYIAEYIPKSFFVIGDIVRIPSFDNLTFGYIPSLPAYNISSTSLRFIRIDLASGPKSYLNVSPIDTEAYPNDASIVIDNEKNIIRIGVTFAVKFMEGV
ncbi:Hypothetical protein SRAE_1000114600 [Strongyloides ratti]|uniref:Uncharacterized protein n=1 Tax=Strongyloides ratti TaxID=34506 RepID=A0A090L5V3_STRRB|nr:Hypothetical protein SRAE_1000114600 [Strongyloides ratti]CEF62879.1 Hypothetical protein SRAE_1000114600 [Strongyloides ratti]